MKSTMHSEGLGSDAGIGVDWLMNHSPSSTLAGRLSALLVKDRDEALRRGLARALGRDDWTADELQGRLLRRTMGLASEWFCDGVLIMREQAPEMAYSDDGRTATLTQKRWVLGDPAN